MSDSDDYDGIDETYDSDYIPEDDDEDYASTALGGGHSKGKAKDVENQISFSSLTPETLRAQLDKEVDAIVGVIGVPPELASILLMHYRWNKDNLIELYMDNSTKTLKAAGEPGSTIVTPKAFESPPHKRARLSSDGEDIMCGVCCDSFSSANIFELRCGHQFCRECWKCHFVTKIKDEGQCLVPCMETGCPTIADEPFIKFIVNETMYKRYQALVLSSFVQANPDYRFCPHPSCDQIVFCQGARGSTLLTAVPTVECGQKHVFCFGCALDTSHKPTLCKIAAMWNDAREDSGTSQWIKANTRTCPKCHNSIEKSGGCNRMVCRHCNFQFCWVCLKDWNVHGYNKTVCNSYVEPEKDEHMNEAAKKLQRWLFYYDRFTNHDVSAKLDQELANSTEEKMLAMTKTSQMSWIETQFLKTAVDELTSCRQTLKWSYAMAYFLMKGNQKAIFEDIQADLEQAVEQLSQLLEEPIEEDNSKELRQKITDRTVYVQRRHGVVLDDVAKGLLEGTWEWTISLEDHD